MEVNLPSIFSENFTTRTAGFSIIIEILRDVPGVNVSRMMSELGRSYDDKGGDSVDMDSARKAIEIMSMVAVHNVYPRFFSKVEVVKVLLGILSKHGVSGWFGESVELMFQSFSIFIHSARVNQRYHVPRYFFPLSRLNLMLDSQETIRKYLPGGNEEILSPGKALCLKGIVGTFIWTLGSEKEMQNVWNCVRIVFETQHVEAIHASLAEKLIAVNSASNEDLSILFTAIAPLLEKAKDARNGELCRALCELLTTILVGEYFTRNIRTLLCLNSNYAAYLFGAKDGVLDENDRLILSLYKKFVLAREKLQSILAKCDFDNSLWFGVACAKLAIDLI